MDETSCWAIFARLGQLGVTREMTTRFLRPVTIESDLVVEGQILEHDQRGAVVKVSLSDTAGNLLAEGESTWAFPRLSRIADLAEVQEETLKRFLDECCPKKTIP
jgi:acyl-coenzyme A thioesterase PaaI-like protein